MANVFDKIGDIKNNVNRNSFDWTKTNNFTTAFGRITPVYCEYCPPNSSVKVNPEFGLRFMPMMFPVQTNMKAYLSFYRVPVRTLWKDYKDFISSPNDSTNNLEAPYVSVNPSTAFKEGAMFGVSGLADYLGIPVTAVLGEAGFTQFPNKDPELPYANVDCRSTYREFKLVENDPEITRVPAETFTGSGTANVFRCLKLISAVSNTKVPFPATFDFQVTISGMTYSTATLWRQYLTRFGYAPGADFGDNGVCFLASCAYNAATKQVSIFDRVKLKSEDIQIVQKDSDYNVILTFHNLTVSNTSEGNEIYMFFPNVAELVNSDFTCLGNSKEAEILANYNNVPLTVGTCPYWVQGGSDNVSKNRIKLSAYPFRAYEAIYNAYIRNIKNNPFKINNKPVYNTWIPTDAGGEDKTPYGLHYANWASDMFTTAVPSPQQGKAPLVGVTTYSRTVELEDGNSRTELAFAMVDEDGKKYAVDFDSNGEELKGVKYRELGSNQEVSPVRNLYDLVTSGISINDFRNVNAYQRYLELNMFRGYSYKDIIEGRFDVNIKYDDLNMPEYLGGVTRDITMSPVTQTVETSSDGSYLGSLGSQSGYATLYGNSKSDISCFCDEESYIIGILTVVPMPVYTQVLPKHFLYRDRLDVFNPEFDHIGFQPIKMNELCPVNQFVTDSAKMGDTFGYQRPWYEYVQKLDTASGLFRTQLRNFLINRVFKTPPELGSEFTTVNPSEVNDVFSVTETTDKILGQIIFHATAKLPISRVVVPKLE